MEAFEPMPTLQELQEVFAFTDDDVTANHNGHLSVNQQNRLRRTRLLCIIGVAAALVCWSILLFDPQKTIEANLVRYAIFILPALLLAYKAYQVHQDLKANHVSLLSGSIKLTPKLISKPHAKKPEYSYSFMIDGQSFDLSRYKYEMLIDETNYNIYYLARHKVILSIVPV